MLRSGHGRRSFGRRSLVAAASPPAACAYPFNASRATIQSFGFTDRLALSNADQNFTYTIQGGLATPQAWAAAPAVMTTLDASTGIVAFEWSLDHDPNFSGGAPTDISKQELVLFTGALAEAMKIVVTYQAGVKSTDVYLGGSPVFSGTPTVTRFGIWLDANTSMAHVKVDSGTELSLSSNTYTPQPLTPVAEVIESDGVNGTFAGQIVGSSFVSSAASYVYGYPAGTVDLCGNSAPLLFLTNSSGDLLLNGSGDYLVA